MQEKKFVKTFRAAKIIQLCIALIIEITFFLILFLHPSMSKQIYSDKVLFTICITFWVLMLFVLICLIYDFGKLKSFAEESHALNKAAYLDHLTGIPNRHGLDAIFDTYDSPESMTKVGCYLGTIENLKEINESLGHAKGDQTIQAFCSIFEEVGDLFGVIGRNNGNEFVMVINNCSKELMQRFIDNLNKRINEYNTLNPNVPIKIRYTYLLNTDEHAETFTQLLTATYTRLRSQEKQ